MSTLSVYDIVPHPDDQEAMHEYGRMEFSKQHTVKSVDPTTLRAWGGKPLGDAFKAAKKWQRDLIKEYSKKEPEYPNNVIIIDGGTIVDGHHRAMAACQAKHSILAIDLSETNPQRNPRAYHGTHQEVAAFVSVPRRELRNYESIGTFVTTDKEHAKMFGKYIHQVDLPEPLKFYADHDRDDLRAPFLLPALKSNFLKVGEKKLLTAAFVAAPVDNDFFGVKCYEQVSEEYGKLLRELHKDQDNGGVRLYKFFHRHPNVSKYVTKCESALETARDISREKIFQNKEYALFVWNYYTSRGYDGIAWENTCMDAGFHDSEDHRQSQYLIFHPDRYQFSPAD